MGQQVPGLVAEVNILDYEAKKLAGVTKVVKIQGRVYLAQKKFNTDTGEAESLLVPLEKKQLESAKVNLEKNLAALVSIIADVDAAKESA